MGKKSLDSKLSLHPNFSETIDDLQDLEINLPKPSQEDFSFGDYTYPTAGDTVQPIEEIDAYSLNPERGKEISREKDISAYDESIQKYSALEGTAYLTSHSLIHHGEDDFDPATYLTFYFYTRSKEYTDQAQSIKFSDEPETDSKRDYVRDRSDLLLSEVNEDSILIIDGPLIGGQISSQTLELNEKLFAQGIMPIFIVKNSSSNLIVDHIKEFSGKFNSDIHWVYNLLSDGERSNFFKYVDQHNPENAKVFCYVKPFNSSPLRVEFDARIFEDKEEEMRNYMHLIYYLVLAQGNRDNPQPRSVAIAEKYARTTLNLINLEHLMKSIGVMPEVNQSRF